MITRSNLHVERVLNVVNRGKQTVTIGVASGVILFESKLPSNRPKLASSHLSNCHQIIAQISIKLSSLPSNF